MKNEKLFYKTIDILVKAYINGTLQKGNCAACAVGNIVASCNERVLVKRPFGFVQEKYGEEVDTKWNYVHAWGHIRDITFKAGLDEIASTGYTHNETLQIEIAFERNTSYSGVKSKDRSIDIYYGLMSVVDTLMQIHECTAEEIQSAKLQFVKA